MLPRKATDTEDVHALADEQLVAMTREGNAAAFRAIMKRNNRRLYRAARGVLANDAEAEDVVQETYLRAFAALPTFRGDASLSTWLTRIAINEALARKRKHEPSVGAEALDVLEGQEEVNVLIFPGVRSGSTPEGDASRAEIRRMLETAVDNLPQAFRVVFVLRDIEQLSIEETAAQLDLRPETVKTRLHRARTMLRDALDDKLAGALQDTFAFDGTRCERMTQTVLRRLNLA